MSDLVRSYRALPAAQRALVAGLAVVVALVLLINLPHILGAVVTIGLTLVALAISVAILAGLVLVVYAVVRAIGSRA